MKKKIFIFSMIIFLTVGFTLAKEAIAGASHNVWGWAWSENIGWISFNCLNDYDGDGIRDDRCSGINPNTGLDYVNYGVSIDPSNGNFLSTSYAWSENIGWIWFAPTDNPPGEVDPNPAKLTGTEVSGWARALANGGGWDGWIKLRGTWLNGVSLDTTPVSPDPDEFEGWAWGSDVVGWISFNHLDCDPNGDGDPSDGPAQCVEPGRNYSINPIPDYKVMTDVNINPVPSADTLAATRRTDPASNCFAVSAPIDFTWRFVDPGDSQSAYQVQIATNNAFSPLFINSGKVEGSLNIYTPSGLSYNTDYYWRLKVWDNGDPEAESDWIYSIPEKFNTGSRWPEPDFDISPVNPPAGAEVTFADESICYTASGGESCQNLASSYLWDFGDGETISQSLNEMGDTTHIYADSGNYTVKLKVSDNIGACSVGFPLTAVLRLPTWKEVPPF